MHVREQVSYCLLRDDRGADLVVGFKLATFCNSGAISAEIHFPVEPGSYVAFRPIELTLIIALQDLTNVPLVAANQHPNSKNSAEVPSRLIERYKSAA